MHYFQFNIKTYQAATAHLSNEEDLAYRRLIEYYYDTELPIPTDNPLVSRRLRVGLPELTTALNEFFLLTEKGWVHEYCDSQILEYHAYVDRQRNNGKRGGRPKTVEEIPTANPPVSQNNPVPSQQETINNKQLTTNNKQLTKNQEPRTLIPSSKKLAAPKSELGTELQTACKQTWQAYCDAYFNRYGTEPVRNQKVNSQIKGFVQRLGFPDSPYVAAHYVQSNNSYYVQRGHSADGLLADAEKLRTEWATGRTITATRARQVDQTEANRSLVGDAMQIYDRMKKESSDAKNT